MKEISLTQGKVAQVDDEDFDNLNQFKWCAQKGRYTFYAMRKGGKHSQQKLILMHRVLLNLTDPKLYADHKDGNGLNNQRSNIRVCTRSENNMNSRKQSICSSIYKGVSWHKACKKWEAQIQLNGKKIKLGVFINEIDAAKKYNEAAKKYHSSFANINNLTETYLF